MRQGRNRALLYVTFDHNRYQIKGHPLQHYNATQTHRELPPSEDLSQFTQTQTLRFERQESQNSLGLTNAQHQKKTNMSPWHIGLQGAVPTHYHMPSSQGRTPPHRTTETSRICQHTPRSQTRPGSAVDPDLMSPTPTQIVVNTPPLLPSVHRARCKDDVHPLNAPRCARLGQRIL